VEDYDGTVALFTIPLDVAKADTKAQKHILDISVKSEERS
jgi:hypothetical protein